MKIKTRFLIGLIISSFILTLNSYILFKERYEDERMNRVVGTFQLLYEKIYNINTLAYDSLLYRGVVNERIRSQWQNNYRAIEVMLDNLAAEDASGTLILKKELDAIGIMFNEAMSLSVKSDLLTSENRQSFEDSRNNLLTQLLIRTQTAVTLANQIYNTKSKELKRLHDSSHMTIEVLIFILFIYFVILFYFINKGIIGPVMRIKSAIESFGKGNLSEKVHLSDRSEIGYLVNAYNEMIDNMQEITVSRDTLIEEMERRKNIEEDLRISENRFRRAFELTPYGKALIDLNGGWMDVNAAFCEIVGYSKDELTRLNIKDITYPDDLSNDANYIARLISKEIPSCKYEKRYRHKDGHIVWVFTGIASIEDLAGNITHFISQIVDITRQKILDARLKGSEERYKTFFEQSPDGILVVDPVTTLPVEFNYMAHKQLGYSREEFANIRVNDYELIENEEETKRHVANILQYGKDDFETRHKTKDGEVRNVRVTVKLLQIDNRNLIFTIFRDITEFKKMQEDIVLKARLLDASSDSYILIDDTGKILYANESTYKSRGFTREEMFGSSISIFTSKRDNEKTSERLKVSLEKKEFNFESEHIKKDGSSFPVDVISRVIELDDSEVVMAVIRDITHRKKIEEALRYYTLLLEQSNRELEQFAFVASHDLQEPLRKIVGFTEILSSEYKDIFDDEARECMDYIVDGAQRMRTLITDILAYSRITTRGKELKPVDTNKVLNKVLKDIATIITETDAAITHGTLPAIMGDDSQIYILLQNLILNGIKYVKKGEPPRIHIGAARGEREWIFSIADNGIGIDSQFYEKIFVIFQRLHTRDEYSGTGIGLAVCKKIVERHNGRIWVDSVHGSGSTFYFSFPIIEEAR